MRRRLREVQAERQHLVLAALRNQAAIELGSLRDVIGVEDGLANRNRVGCAEFRCLTGCFVGEERSPTQSVQDAIHDEEDGHLQQQRQTRGQGIHLVLLVELHHLFVELLAIVFVLGLKLLHFRLQALHFEHALGALQGQWGDQHHHGERNECNSDRIVMRQRIELRYEPSGTFKHGLHHFLRKNVWNGVITTRTKGAATQ